MTFLIAALLGVIQGLTEFLPISSTAHLLLAGELLRYDDDVFTVMIVRDSVWLTLRLTTCSSGSRRIARRFSRTRSKMTMVSFTE